MVDFMFLAIFMLVSFCNHNVTQYCICFLSHFWINLALNEVFEYDYFTKLVFLIEGLFRLLNHHIFEVCMMAMVYCCLWHNLGLWSLWVLILMHASLWKIVILIHLPAYLFGTVKCDFICTKVLRFFFFNHSHFLLTGWALCWNCGFFYWIYFHINIRCEFFCAACVLMLFPSSSSGLIWYIF